MTRRVLTAEMSHETNSFSVQETDERAFRRRYVYMGEEAIAERGHQNTELAGFLDVGRARGWDVNHVLSAAAGPSGRVTGATFDWLCGPILSALEQRSVDAVLLGLHGAMDLDFCEDGEGELLRRIRAVVGADMPIAITLDPHANVSRQMCELADIVVSFKTTRTWTCATPLHPPGPNLRPCGRPSKGPPPGRRFGQSLGIPPWIAILPRSFITILLV